jgi:RNA polymerase sigma factor (sigma-70 family)
VEDLTILIMRSQAGDLTAFDHVVRRFQDMAVGYAYSRLGDFHLAEDAAQEAFLQAYRDIAMLHEPAAFPGWLKTIVRTFCDRFTRGKKLELVPLDAVTEVVSRVPDPEQQVEEQERKEWVLSAIQALPEEERMVTTLFYISEYSHSEIATFLEIPLPRVNNRLRAARKRLKTRMVGMAKKKLHEEAPSRDETFAQKIQRMIRPRELTTTEYHRWISHDRFGKGAGTDIWEMFCAALTGDLPTIRTLVMKHPELVHCAYNYTQPIHFAVREGHTAVVRFLLDHGANLSYRTYYYRDSLLTMAKDRGHQDVVRLLEEELRRRFRFSPEAVYLLQAVDRREHDRVATLLERTPALINAGDDFGETALHTAARNGDFFLVRWLVDRGADVDAQRSDGFRPIHEALFRNSFGWRREDQLTARSIAGYLLGRGAEYTIHLAAVLGDREQVRRFLQDDPTLANFEETCHMRPIAAAAARGDGEMVQLLLDHGADPNLPQADAPRGYALWAAANGGHTEVVRLLLEHGADLNAEVESCGTPLGQAMDKPEIRRMFLARGARERSSERDALFKAMADNDVAMAEEILRGHPEWAGDEEAQNAFWGEGILTGPAQSAQFDILNLLLRYGAQVPKVSKWGQSYYFHYEVTKFLLEHGMDPNHQNWLRMTLLHEMAAAGNLDKAKLLLDFGADINARDEEYRSTPLGWAARWGRKEMVELLLERGAKTNLPDDEPWATPLAWAEKKGHAKIAEILRKHGATR